MNNIWMLDIDTVIKIYDLAKEHGKKPGDSMEEEFIEILKQNPDKFNHLGKTTQDVDLFTGNLREEGVKVINLKEKFTKEP